MKARNEIIQYVLMNIKHFRDAVVSKYSKDYCATIRTGQQCIALSKINELANAMQKALGEELFVSLSPPDDEKILEERVDFDNVYKRVMWKLKIDNL